MLLQPLVQGALVACNLRPHFRTSGISVQSGKCPISPFPPPLGLGGAPHLPDRRDDAVQRDERRGEHEDAELAVVALADAGANPAQQAHSRGT